jgi:hypothetical protein
MPDLFRWKRLGQRPVVGSVPFCIECGAEGFVNRVLYVLEAVSTAVPACYPHQALGFVSLQITA